MQIKTNKFCIHRDSQFYFPCIQIGSMITQQMIYMITTGCPKNVHVYILAT